MVPVQLTKITLFISCLSYIRIKSKTVLDKIRLQEILIFSLPRLGLDTVEQINFDFRLLMNESFYSVNGELYNYY